MTVRSVIAPAKVNLYLHVTGRREDGYHLLESLVAFTDFGDRISVAPADALTLTVGGPFADRIPTGPDNLILRAAAGLRALTGVAAGAAIHLDKELPVAAGIGGGSADAAAALAALCHLWDVTPDVEGLARLALALGADVPVCLRGRPAHMAGIGEDVTPAPDLPPLGVVLVNPLEGLSTPAVFKARRGDFGLADRMEATGFANPPALLDGLRRRRNDLTEAAIRLAPPVGAILTALEALDGCRLARMSGSGATCFALFDNADAAHLAAQELHHRHPQWWIRATLFR